MATKAVPRSRRPTKFYACDECGKTFTSHWGLKLHEPVHTGKWKYTCSMCDRGFMETKKFDAHMLAHKKKLIKHNLL